MSHLYRRAHQIAVVGTLAIILAIVLVGCGNTSAPVASTLQDCGSINQLGAHVSASSTGAEACFQQAAQHCQRATLTYVRHGVDDSTTMTFTISPGSSGCSITLASKHSMAGVSGPPPATTTVTCSGAVMDAQGLAVKGCGKVGDVIIPPSS